VGTAATSPRLRRLAADFEAVRSAFTGHRYVIVSPMGASPPDRYRVVYNVPGLVVDGHNKLHVVWQHVVDIQLGAAYPRDKPYCIAKRTLAPCPTHAIGRLHLGSIVRGSSGDTSRFS
jgi:hypothetical protein